MMEARSMMFWFQLCVVVALLIAVGWVAVGGGGHLSPPTPDRPDPALPDTGLLARDDVDKVRFSVGARGYRMDEVDDMLDRLAYEIDVRERRIAELEGHPDAASADSDAPAREPSSDPAELSQQAETQVSAEPEGAQGQAE
jgi:DivIVA domain-containing protein